MSVENEGDSLIPFIDEGEEEEVKGQYNLTITRNYQNKTRRVEISKILQDVEPMTNRSLSPVAPLAYESDTDGVKSDLTELTGAEFELTIKSNNSVIKIQGFDNKSTITFNSGKAKGENVYDFLSKEVDKIFKKPERDEIERAVRSINEKRKLKPICRQKRNTWKAIAKSLVGLRGKSNQRRGSIERYPKIVLLQDPKPPPSTEEVYPKMVMIDGNEGNGKLKIEEIEKNKTNLDKGKEFLNEKRMLKKKKEEREDRKTNLGDDIGDRKKEANIMAEEKLCVELEKQLLGEKKDVLKKEKRCDGDDLTNTKRVPPLEAEDISYTPVPPFYCQYPNHCPYMPIYSRTLPYYPYDFCCSGRIEKKHSGTQTEPEIVQHIDTLDPNPNKDINLPFGILSSFFPRIVVMKSFQEEVSSDDAQIFEIPKTETPPENEKEDEESESTQSVELDKKQEEMSGESMPLTKIGRSICDKLNELAMERKKEAEESAMESEGVEVVETEIEKSPGDVTLECGNITVTSALDDENLKTVEKTVVRKSELWHPSNASTGDTAKGSDRICVSVSDNRSVVLTIRLSEERKPTREAKVGTDGIDIAGGDFTCRQQKQRSKTQMDAANLSPRTDSALRTLQNKLEEINGGKKPREFKFPGFFFIQPFDSRYRSFPSDDYIMTKGRERRDVSGGKPREYYCEECLATMRLIEDENPNVKTMIDRFERIIHLGTY